jgi:hypothetical protein
MIRIILKSLAARAAAVALLLLLAVAADVGAQNAPPMPAPAPKSAEVLKLEEEKAQAELRKAIAEANKATLEAQFPKPTTTPLAGTTTVEGAVIESQMVSYERLAVAANKLVKQLKCVKPGIKTLIVYNEREVNLILSYRVALNQLELMKMGYGQLIEPKPATCPKPETGSVRFRLESLEPKATSALVGPIPLMTLATSIFGSFVDLTALLRTNVEVKGQSFDIEEAALVSEVFRAANAKDGLGAPLFYPAIFPPNLDFKVDEIKSDFLTRLDSLNNLKAYAEGLADALEAAQKGIKKAETSIENLKASVEGLTARKREAEAKLSDLEKIYGSSQAGNRRQRRIPPEKLEVMLELRRTIGGLQKQLDEILNKPDGKLARAEAERDRLKAELKCLLSKLKPELQDPEKLEDTLAKLRAKNEQFAKFVEALVKADNLSGLNSLTSYIKVENVLAALKGAASEEADFYWLQLKVLKAGGNNRVKTNLVVDVFTGGNRLSHSGGAVVEYILFDRNGKSVASDILTEYSGYVKADKIKNLKNPVNVEDK